MIIEGKNDSLDANVIPINASVGVDLEIRRAQNKERPCVMRHKNIVVDGKARTVTCSDCGFVLDPFEYLLDWAVEGDRRMQSLRAVRVQQKVIEAECAALDIRIKNARATLRRAGASQPDEERRLFRSAKWNPERADAILAAHKPPEASVPAS